MGFRDIYDHFVQSILDGNLKPGSKVPSIRVLAKELGVAKKTAETAYEILVGEGYLVSRGAKGTFVSPDVSVERKSAPEPASNVQDRDLNKIIALRDGDGYFRLGVPSLDEFPQKKWLLLSGKAVRSMRTTDMTNPPVMGYAPLRQAIANYLNLSRGLSCSPEQIIITSGYKNSVWLILQALSQKADKVVFEDPGYFFGQKLLKRTVLNLHYVPVDKEGMDVDYLERNHNDAKFVFTTPTHQSPLTVTLSKQRRTKLTQWAHQNDAWIIEDDYDGEFHFKKTTIPSLKKMDTNDRVIYMGTFSKTVMPSVRVSYIVAPRAVLSSFNEVAEIVGTGISVIPQKILALFISEGYFFKHLKKMRSLYQRRRAMVLNALHEVYSNDFEYEPTDGGMHIIAFLKEGVDDVRLSDIWQSYGLLVFPLSTWYANKSKRYGLVIGYTNIRSEAEAVQALNLPYKETVAFFHSNRQNM